MIYLKTITPPADGPVTVDEAKAHLVVDGFDDEALIRNLINAARDAVEAETGTRLLTQTRAQLMDGFPVGAIALAESPVTAISLFEYVDTAGVPQTLAANTGYRALLTDHQAILTPALGTGWPATAAVPGAVTIRYQAGYSDAAAVPAAFKQAMLLLIGHWYENREATVAGQLNDLPMAVKYLLQPFRRPVL